MCGNCVQSISGVYWAAGQLRPLRHHIYRGAVVGVRGAAVGARGAAVGARGAVVGVRGAAVGNIGMHTYIRHICAPVHVLQQYIYMIESDQGLVAAGYSIYNIYYRYSNESKT